MIENNEPSRFPVQPEASAAVGSIGKAVSKEMQIESVGRSRRIDMNLQRNLSALSRNSSVV